MRSDKLGLRVTETKLCYEAGCEVETVHVAVCLSQCALRDERYVDKLSNLLSLTECGFYDLLEEDGLFCLNMDV